MTKTPADPEIPARRRRSVKLLLIVSLALNLLVVGVLVGGLIRQDPPGAHRSAGGSSGIGSAAILALPHETRQALREELSRDDTSDRQADRLAALPALLDELRSEDYDAQTFAEDLRDIRRARNERLAEVELALARRIASMSAAERAAYADQLEEMLRNPQRHGRR